MLKRGLIISVSVLLLTGCSVLSGMVQTKERTIPPAPNLESLKETENGTALSFNPDNPAIPIPFRTKRHGIYLDPADASELLIWIEQIESE